MTRKATRTDPTLIGRVKHVLGATVTVQLLDSVAGSSPLYRGQVYSIGQVGSLITIPQGGLRLVGAVSMMGIAELMPTPEPSQIPHQGDRWLRVQLLGELNSLGDFQRGTGTFPAIDDDVHFATADDIGRIYPGPQAGFVPIGSLSFARSEVLRLDAAKLVTRHAAVIGSTGSGKSSTVARLVQNVIRSGMKRANIVIIDPHGEYASAFKGDAAILSVLGQGDSALTVPYWAMNQQDLICALLGESALGTSSVTLQNKVRELVVKGRRKFLEDAKWAHPRPEDVSPDDPIPFDINEVWHALDFENNATSRGSKISKDFAVAKLGDPSTLRPTKFEPYGPGKEEPVQSTTYGHYRLYPERLRSRLQDPLYAFLCRDRPDPTKADPLPAYLSSWLGGKQPISVLDFSGVPADAADVAIGAVLGLLLEVAIACPRDEGVGRARPMWILLEEAHRYLGETTRVAAGSARRAAERITREGRKYGVGLCAISQRPSEISETVLSQCGTVISMRLTNPSDQGRVKSALPDVVANLADALPSLRTGEALVSGEAVLIPTRVLVERPSPAPAAEDASLASWLGEVAENDVIRAVARWRGADPAATPRPAAKEERKDDNA